MKKTFKKIIVSILIAEAAFLLRRKKPTIVAITGSVGKTTTKDAIYAAIKGSVRARKSQKSFNSDIGVPLTVLGLPNGWSNPFLWLKNIIDGFFIAVFSADYPDVLILETGIDHPGDMDKLTSWMKPDIVVLTRLPDVPVHVEAFRTPQAVIDEKMKLVTALKVDGKLIYNNDDPIIQAQLADVLQEQVSFSRYLPADFQASADKIIYSDDKPAGVEFTLTHLNKKHKVKLTNTVGTQHMYSVCAAIAVALELGVDIDAAIASVQTIQTPNGRMRLIPGLKSSVLIDDTYNSSPIATESALQALEEIKYAGRKIVVLGDMLELGQFSAEQHKHIGERVAKSAHMLLTVGVRARGVAEGALAGGMKESNIFQYDEVLRTGQELQSFLKSGDVVLIKASQGIRAERIVEEVMSNPEDAPELLVRQDNTWKSII
jgi:UDP-N-acetylmuramoyl-tripeptide--D-alanyl-D-alanine ligase